MLDADLVQTEVDPPLNRWCSCGHEAPALYRRAGPKSPQEPTRFFHLQNKDKSIDAIYCEPCLVIAHYIARLKKAGKI